jgi:hypothetical protein
VQSKISKKLGNLLNPIRQLGGGILLILVHAEQPIGMNEVISPWVCGEGFTPDHDDVKP